MELLVINVLAISIYLGGIWATIDRGNPVLAAMAWPVRLGYCLGNIAADVRDHQTFNKAMTRSSIEGE